MNKIESKVFELLKQKSNNFIGLKQFEKNLVKNYVILSNSFEDYAVNHSVPESKKIKWYLINLFLMVNIIKYAIIFFVDKPWLTSSLGELVYILYKMKVMSCFMFVACFNTSVFMINSRFLEVTKKFVILDEFNKVIADRRIDGMRITLQRKFAIYCLLLNKGIVELQVQFILVLVVILLTLLVYLAYHDTSMQNNLVSLLFGAFNFFVLIKYLSSIGLITITLFILNVIYLKYKFIDFLKFLDQCVKQNSNFEQAIVRHKVFSDLLLKSSKFINIILGCFYNLNPILIVITVQILIDDATLLWVKALMGLSWSFVFMAAFIISKLSTWIPTNNMNIPNMIYPLICARCKHKEANLWTMLMDYHHSLRWLLKLDEFIAALNTNFLGFYCFNLFKFTKQSFYQLFLTISLVYILIIKTVNTKGAEYGGIWGWKMANQDF